MSKLKELFEAREEAVKAGTDAIFEALSNVMTGAEQYLNVSDQLSGGTLEWENASFLPALEDEDDPIGYIIMSGMISHEPGQSFTLASGKVIEITETIAPYFRRMIRIGFPHKIATEGSIDEIVHFMQNVEKSLPQPAIDDLDMMVTSSVADFDLDELSEEQRAALVLSHPDGSKN